MQYMLSYTNSNICICFRLLLFPLKNIHLFGLPSGPTFTGRKNIGPEHPGSKRACSNNIMNV